MTPDLTVHARGKRFAPLSPILCPINLLRSAQMDIQTRPSTGSRDATRCHICSTCHYVSCMVSLLDMPILRAVVSLNPGPGLQQLYSCLDPVHTNPVRLSRCTDNCNRRLNPCRSKSGESSPDRTNPNIGLFALVFSHQGQGLIHFCKRSSRPTHECRFLQFSYTRKLQKSGLPSTQVHPSSG